MSRSRRGRVFWLSAICWAFIAMSALSGWGQAGAAGKVTVTVFDPSKAVLSGAALELQDLATNDKRAGVTQDSGVYTFVNLSNGTYKLTISKTGFETRVYGSVVVHAGLVTDINASLAVGAVEQSIEVSGSSIPLVETSASNLGATIDTTTIDKLPISGRDLTQLASYVPGAVKYGDGSGGTWNGLPQIAVVQTIDGIQSNFSRQKFLNDTSQNLVQPRVENIAEMAVQTGQLDVDQGFGQAAMSVNYATKRGTNQYHGRVFEDFQNSWLNANSWTNKATGVERGHFILNDFGASIGGPIIKDKLFFFGTWAQNIQPNPWPMSADVLTPAAQAGNFTYVDANQVQRTVNVYQIAQTYNPALPSSINPVIQKQLGLINGSTKLGSLTPNGGDPNLQTLAWNVANPLKQYFPVARLDYNASQNFRINLNFNASKSYAPYNGGGPSPFPGSDFSGIGTGENLLNYTTSLGIEWTVRPTLINQFRFGFLYNKLVDGDSATSLWQNSAGSVSWPIGTSPQQFQFGAHRYYPVFNMSDTATWQHGAHQWSFGFSAYRENDRYWDGLSGVPNVSLGLVSADPAFGAFTNENSSSNPTLPGASDDQKAEAMNLYALLVGRVTGASTRFPLNAQNQKYELGRAKPYDMSWGWGLFLADSWRYKTNLTLNYGLRWDFMAPTTDVTGLYHNLDSSSMFGPSGINNLFNPGALRGDLTGGAYVARPRPYGGTYKTPQPQIGFAWSPQIKDGLLGKLTNGMVVRGGYQLRYVTEPAQYFWDFASDNAAFYYQNNNLQASTITGQGFFAPGSMTLTDQRVQDSLYLNSPSAYQKVIPISSQTYLPGAANFWGMDSNLKMPYTQSWNLGIQRSLGANSALEIRYVGNRTIHQWWAGNTNEINVFENGFLDQFKIAERNMAINAANGVANSFANMGFAGQQPTPIFDAAFGSGDPDNNYAFPNFLSWLRTGQVGNMAAALSTVGGARGGSGTPYFCNMVGQSFAPCGVNIGYTGNGAGYPINFFQANPYMPGGTLYLQSAGYSNYNGLQVEFRQKNWHGMQVDANYTWSHTLGIIQQNQWLGTSTTYTLRDLHKNYGPTNFDLRHVVHVSGTYDLPVGKGKTFSVNNNVVDHIVSGWTVGTVLTMQSGAPFWLTGNYMTYNDYGAGGIILNGITQSQMQDAVGVYKIPGKPYVLDFNPSILASPTGGAVASKMFPNTTPGTITPRIFLYGPRYWNDDIGITKRVQIREGLKFNLMAEFLNAFNHTNFGTPNSNVRDKSAFGHAGAIGSPRHIELRATFEF